MRSKTDQNFIAFCDELRAYVEEHHLFPDKHTRLSHIALCGVQHKIFSRSLVITRAKHLSRS